MTVFEIVVIVILTIGYNYWHDVSSKEVKAVRTNIFAKKIACCINLQLPILVFVKSIISDMHHRITYIYQFSAKLG